LHWMYL